MWELACLRWAWVSTQLLVWRCPCGRGGATIRLAPDGGLRADQDAGSNRVHIRYLGNGHYWFRSYSGSLLKKAQK
ncbi:hypothetical protein [Pseudomonas synxantha]|nr:hypothetical protein [Pseudomonas synxantha]